MTDFRGFYWNKDKQKWRVRVQYKKRRYLVGDFDDKVIAHLAYLTRKEELHAQAAARPAVR